MKRLILTIICGAFFSAASAQDMQTLFLQMPEQYIPQLQEAWRKDLTDLYKKGKEARLKNNMDGYATLAELTDDYLLLQSTERTRIEMKRLSLINNTYVICMVTTLFGPVPDSQIAFFSTDWKPLNPTGIFTPPTPEEFFLTGCDTTSIAWQDTRAALDMNLMEYRLGKDEPTLTVTYTTPLYLSKEMREKAESFLEKEPKKYVWENSRFTHQP